MPSYIDTHIHIIPGIDDGAESLDLAVEMAKIAAADGVKAVIATPHCLNGTYTLEASTILAGVEHLREQLDQHNIDLTIYPGAELHSHRQLRRLLDEKKVLSLAGSQYVLLEWPHRNIPDYTDQLIFELVTAGYRPIIAHPERHGAVQSDPNRLYYYLERGALAQLTAGSVTGVFGEKVANTSRILIEHGMAHFVATDAHGTSGRSPTLSQAFQQVSEWVGEKQAQQLVLDNPEAILANSAIEVNAEPYEKRKFSWWTRLWKRA